jgi:tetratricopeptide (TPR) repeat protein
MGNARGRALVQSNAAWLWHALVGDDARANAIVQDALEVYDRIDDKRGRAHCVALLGSIAGRQGHPDEAVTLFNEAIQLTRDAGDAWLLTQALRDFAAFELSWSQATAGLAHALEAEALCKDHGMNDLVVAVRALVARLYLRDGNLEKAAEYARRAMREIRPGIELAHMVPFSMGEVLEAQGERDEAMRYFVQSHDLLVGALRGLDERHLAMSLENVPAHRIVHEKWRSQQAEIVEVRLPSIAAPTGRPLTDSDHVTVRWTVHDPTDNSVDDRASRRHVRLIRLLGEAANQQAVPTVEHLAKAVGASSATVRRDLALLRRQGSAVATRGSR